MNSDYTQCIRNFAAYSTGGQVSSGGNYNATQSFQGYNTSNYQTQNSSDSIYQLLELFSSGSQQVQQQPNYSPLLELGLNLLLQSVMGSNRGMADYIAENHFDADLTWKNGKIKLTEEQWSLVDDLKVNMFIDDGKGYIDMGCDNIYDIDAKGNLLKITDKTWLAASGDGQNWIVIPYYYLYCTKDGEKVVNSVGKVPVRINGERANLLLELDDEGIELAGVNYRYDDADVIAKYTSELTEGDKIEFIAGYYDYNGNYQASYVLDGSIIFKDKLYFGDVSIADYKTKSTYQFRDIYQQNYWTTPME